MYFATAAAILLLANASYVHGSCAVTPNATTGAVIIPTNWTEIGVEVSSRRVSFQFHNIQKLNLKFEPDTFIFQMTFFSIGVL